VKVAISGVDNVDMDGLDNRVGFRLDDLRTALTEGGRRVGLKKAEIPVEMRGAEDEEGGADETSSDRWIGRFNSGSRGEAARPRTSPDNGVLTEAADSWTFLSVPDC
jgi:hypothetical protein